MSIWIPQGKIQGRSRGAFQSDELRCPHLVGRNAQICGAKSWHFVERIGPYRILYRCKVCGRDIQYDFTNNPEHPYAVFGKSKWQRIVDRWSQAQAAKARSFRW